MAKKVIDNYVPTPDEVFGGKQVIENYVPTPDEVFNRSTGMVNRPDFIANEPEKPKLDPDKVLDGIETDNDHEREVLKNLAMKVNEGKASHEDLTDAILTIQGKHKSQNGEKNYYVEDRDGVHIPKPLSKGEHPAGKNIVGTFNDSNWYEDLGSSLKAGAETLGASVLRTPGFLYDVVNQGYNTIDPTLANLEKKAGMTGTPSEMLSTSLGLPKENTWAKALEDKAKQDKETINQKYDKGITDYISKGDYGKAIGAIGNSIAESLPVTLSLVAGNMAGLGIAGSTLAGGAVFGAEKKQEMKDEGAKISENKQNLVAIGSGLAEGLFESSLGITKLGQVFEKALFDSGEKEAKKIVLNGFKEAYRPVLKTMFGTTSEEALGEAATQFTQNAIDKYSGYKPDLDLKQGVADAFIVGAAMGKGFSLLGAGAEDKQKRKVDKINEQNKILFDVVNKGKESVDAFKADIYNGLRNGKISQQDADNAIVKLSAYNDYNKMLSGYELNDNTKQELFDLSFQKQTLVNDLVEGIRGKELEKMNPIEQAQYRAKERMAKDIQDKITDIVTGLTVKQETTVAEKTIEDITKKEKPVETEKKVEIENPILKKLYEQRQKAKEEGGEKQDKRTYEDFTQESYNNPKENWRVKLNALFGHLWNDVTKESKTVVGEITEIPFEYTDKEGNTHVNETYAIKLPDGKIHRFSSSMTRDVEQTEEGITGGHKGHFRQEYFPEISDKQMNGIPIAIKAVEVPALGKDAVAKKAIKAFRVDNGKFAGWLKATNTGRKSEFTPEQEEWLKDEELKHNDIPPSQEGGIMEPKQPKPPVKPSTEGNVQDYVNSKIEELKNNPDADFDESMLGTYEHFFTKEYERKLGKTGSAEVTSQKESESGNDQEVNGQGAKRAKRLVTGTKKANRIIRDERKLKALRQDVFDPYGLALQYFIGGGMLSPESVYELYGDPKEKEARKIYRETGKKDKKPFKGSQEVQARLDYVKKNGPTIQQIAEQIVAENEALGVKDLDVNEVVNAIEDVVSGFNNSTEMANKFNSVFGEKEQYAPAQEEINKADEKAGEMGVSDVFGETVANLESLTDESLNKIANEGSDIITNDDLEDQFQKEYEGEKGDINKVIEVLKKNIPGVEVVFDPDLNAAGKVSGKTITINPYLAGKGTPIHEFGHIIIDAIGYTNKNIQAAIKQLSGTKLWNDTKAKYPELNSEMLAKEVLAEAIGREGADIFDKSSQRSRFKTYLDYIYNWIKQKLGVDKNIAKSLASQIIGGVGVKKIINDANIKAKQETISKFEKAKEMWDKIQETEGGGKKRGLAKARREFLNENPTMQYIENNIKQIFNQLEKTGDFTYKGNCI